MTEAMPSRRAVIAGGLTGGAALAAAGFTTPSYGAEYDERRPGSRVRLTVLGTTDLHGHVYNWDYFKDAEYDDKAHNDVGLAKAATLIKAMRHERRGRADPHHRRRRHHPGHAAGLLLRQDRPSSGARRSTRWPGP